MHAVSFEAAVSFFFIMHNQKLVGTCSPPSPPTDPDPALPRVMYVLVDTALSQASACASYVFTYTCRWVGMACFRRS